MLPIWFLQNNFTISKAIFIIVYHFTTHLTSQTLFLPWLHLNILFFLFFYIISLSPSSSRHRSLTAEKIKNTKTQNGVDYLSLQTALTAICISFFFPLLKPIQFPCFCTKRCWLVIFCSYFLLCWTFLFLPPTSRVKVDPVDLVGSMTQWILKDPNLSSKMLQGVVDFLKNPDTYTSLGVKIPQDLNTTHRSQHHNPHQPPHTRNTHTHTQHPNP